MEIDIPCDEKGFVLLQCQLCGEYFKLQIGDIKDEGNIDIWCPYCGLNSGIYASEEVLDVALKMATNEAMELVQGMFKDLERATKNNKLFKFTVSSEIDKEEIVPIKVKIENLEERKYDCCKIIAKITPLAAKCGSYCPICGGICYE